MERLVIAALNIRDGLTNMLVTIPFTLSTFWLANGDTKVVPRMSGMVTANVHDFDTKKREFNPR